MGERPPLRTMVNTFLPAWQDIGVRRATLEPTVAVADAYGVTRRPELATLWRHDLALPDIVPQDFMHDGIEGPIGAVVVAFLQEALVRRKIVSVDDFNARLQRLSREARWRGSS
jgi:hypothetical protein